MSPTHSNSNMAASKPPGPGAVAAAQLLLIQHVQIDALQLGSGQCLLMLGDGVPASSDRCGNSW